jgi:hypothetical protein
VIQWAKQLSYTGADFQDGRFTFTYDLDGQTLQLHLEHSRSTRLAEAAVRKIGFNLGMCYLMDLAEIALPRQIRLFQKLPPEALFYWRELFEELVIEKCYTLKLPTSMKSVEWINGQSEPDPTTFKVSGPQDHVALALTGGKESLAMLKTLQKHKPVMLFFLNPEMSAQRRRLYEHVNSRFPTVKTISNRLDVLNPLIEKFEGLVSGVDMAHLVFNAMLFADTCSSVLLGNEYSANFPNAIYEGSVVNHQFVKTIRFAERLNNYIHNFITPDFSYYSPVCGLYEFRIADLLLKDDVYLEFLTSCNRYTPKVTFCSHCHKCAFTYLLIRTKRPAKFLANYFSRDLLEDVSLFKPLMDFTGKKPLDCVGDKTEVWVALERLLEQGVQSAVGDYYQNTIRPIIAPELKTFTHLVTTEQRVPLETPADIKAIFDQALRDV